MLYNKDASITVCCPCWLPRTHRYCTASKQHAYAVAPHPIRSIASKAHTNRLRLPQKGGHAANTFSATNNYGDGQEKLLWCRPAPRTTSASLQTETARPSYSDGEARPLERGCPTRCCVSPESGALLDAACRQKVAHCQERGRPTRCCMSPECSAGGRRLGKQLGHAAPRRRGRLDVEGA